MMQDKLPEAVACFDQALRLMPNHVESHNNLGNVLQNLGKLDEALASYERALHLQPDYPIARCNVGLVLQEMGDFSGSEQAYREVLRDNPHHADALSLLATLLRGKLPAADRAVLEQCLAEPKCPMVNDADRAKLLFGLAQVCDAKRRVSNRPPPSCGRPTP